MSCPNCHEELEKRVFGNQEVLHCKNCGGSFFNENGINRISISQARDLAFDKRGNFIFESDKTCPRDQLLLEILKNDEAIPPIVKLYRCPECKGVFVYPDHLVIFKQAQQVKLDYFKIWGITMPSIRSVVVISFVAVFSFSALAGYILLQQGSLAPTQAENVVKNIHATQSGRYVFVSFRTQAPYASRIIFVDKTANKQLEKMVNIAPTTIHYLTTTDLDTTHEITYQIIVTDKNGKDVKTKETKLEVK